MSLLFVLGRRLVAGQQIEWVDTELVGDAAHRVEREIPLAALDARVVALVKAQFSDLMSSTTEECGQARSVGRIRPTPLPERVGAKQRTCSGPLWRK